MAASLKRFQVYAVPILLVYTVMVTWLLLNSAWRQSGDGDAKTRTNVIDVLVQEENRHMRSFRNVVRSYRGFADVHFYGDKESKYKHGNATASNSPIKVAGDEQDATRLTVASTNNTQPKSLHSKRTDLKLRSQNEKEQKVVKMSTRTKGDPKNMVIVEDWPGGGHNQSVNGRTTPITKRIDQSYLLHFKSGKLNDMTLQNVQLGIPAGTSLRKYPLFQNSSHKPQNSEYYLQYCKRIFDENVLTPNICNRPLIESTNRKHIAVNSVSLAFRRVGEVRIFSAFLDVRKQPFVRVLVLAPSTLHTSESNYWCVFLNHPKNNASFEHKPFPANRTRNTTQITHSYVLDGDNVSGSSSSEWVHKLRRQRSIRQHATKLFYYPASDGHARNNQFYIMSCPIPPSAYNIFKRSGYPIKTIYVVEGDPRNMYSNHNQHVFVDVIVNKPLPVGADDDHNTKRTTLQQSIRETSNNYATNKSVEISLTDSRSKISEKSVRKLKSVRNNMSHFDSDDEDVDVSAVIKKTAFNASAIHIEEDLENNRIGSSAKRIVTNSQLRNTSDATSAKLYTDIAWLSSDRSDLVPAPSTTGDDTIVACVSPLHGRVGTIQLIEFIEFTLLLGVQHLVVYLPSYILEAKPVLRVHEARGLVTYLPWDLPHGYSDVWARGRDMALNDCLYRAVGLYNWAIFLELGEYIVPRVTPDLPSFLVYLQEKHGFNASKFSDLVFPSAIFPPPTRQQYGDLKREPNFTSDVNKYSSLKSVHRTYFDPHRGMRMIRPETAFRVGAGERKKTTFNLSSRYAAAHHYGPCLRTSPIENNTARISRPVREHFKDTNNSGSPCSRLKLDKIMWKYISILIERSNASLNRVHRGGN